MVVALPIMMYDFWLWRAEKDEREGRIRRVPPNYGLDMLDVYDDIKARKWNERLAVWLEDWRGWNRITTNTRFPTLDERTKRKDIKRARLIRSMLKIQAYQVSHCSQKLPWKTLTRSIGSYLQE